jgi:hypothetical protein
MAAKSGEAHRMVSVRVSCVVLPLLRFQRNDRIIRIYKRYFRLENTPMGFRQ